MTEKGRVLEIRGSLVTIVPDKEVCFGCMNQECRGKKGFIEAENPYSLPLEKGQEVEITARAASLLRQALTVILPPAISFAAGYILARFFFPGAGEGAAILVGLILLFTAAFIVYAVTGGKNKTKVFTVTRIIKAVPGN